MIDRGVVKEFVEAWEQLEWAINRCKTAYLFKSSQLPEWEGDVQYRLFNLVKLGKALVDVGEDGLNTSFPFSETR